MLLVKTQLNPSLIHGIGLFAAEFIKKDTEVWTFNPLFDLVFTPNQMEGLASSAREQIVKYSYRDLRTGLYILCGDDARFFNHSQNPNCLDYYQTETEGATIACRDITPGEELTCNYALFDLDFVEGKYKLPVSNNFAALEFSF